MPLPLIQKMSLAIWNAMAGNGNAVPHEVVQKIKEGTLLIVDEKTNTNFVPYLLDPYNIATKEIDQTTSAQAHAFINTHVMGVFDDYPDREFTSDEVHEMIDEKVSSIPFVKNTSFFLNLQLENILVTLDTKFGRIEKVPNTPANEQPRYRWKPKS